MRGSSYGKGGRIARHVRLRRKLKGSTERPRLAVFRSLKHVYAQVIDDSVGATLASASSLDTEVVRQRDGIAKIEISRIVGRLVATRSRELGIHSVVFDRGGFKYHGRVKALAEAARENGLKF